MPTQRESWYRGTSWSPADQEAFWSRLRRSRGPGRRAQYLRIQAVYLEQAGIVEPAVSLLEHALSEEPAGFDVAEIHHQLATCREKQGRLYEAIEQLRDALAAEARMPNRGTHAWLTLGRIAVENGMSDLYEEVLANVEAKRERGGGAPPVVFPADRYLLAAILAVINAHLGNEDTAEELARAALSAAAETQSGLRYHPQVGLVTDKDTRLYERVVTLARDG